MWVGPITRAAYPDKTAMGEDVVRILREELRDLVAEGAAFVQFDEPVLTEIVFSEDCTRRTFM
jgi:5-methyltetrahydropteroyltriglutamate--homocysteine methyltransferase